ncbi:receptor-type tyrosine-protein phosphatase S-like [Pecten maximus]|uniref:receptor-type tyrosine-protein phosphatase S-like n=1 Tax=Pecten maximus TaxID=6579 RepID=UPI0014587EB5|nr:receptor-type tyrosine-protein phosphatase S-like [Pecten maximus]
MKVTETDVDEDEVIYVNGPNDTEVRGETKILVSDLKEVVTMKHENDMYEVEFKSLPHGLKHPHKASNLPQNLQLNRFKTTFPYDHSRVILKKEQNDSTDYINANFIDGVRNQKAYIATQGPKTITLEDFWRMTWQNKCGKIIMLANLVEVGKVKCTTYWTGSDGGPLELGLFQVTLQEETEYAFYTIRKLSVKSKQTNSRRQVIQYHFTRWPDHGVPEPFELLQFYKRVKSGHTDLKGPLIVHCSAGIGRTGSYIAMDALLLEGVSSREIDVFAYVEKMRKDRMNMIQTAKQYEMLHFIVLEGLNVVTTSMSKTDLCRVITDMLEGGIPRQQYEVLNAEKPEYKTTDFETALKNKNKNRNQAILAVEKYKTRLMSTTSGYINAVNIPAYRTPYGYILTQHPMDNTTTDFLSLIAQERSDTVVSIGTLQNKPSWPTTKGARTKFGNFLVTTVQCDYHSVGSERVEEKQLAIENKETGTDTQITLFETPSWGMSLPESSFMLELIQVIQCRRGMDAASVIITCRRDQYVFCYKLVKDYLEANTVYANV